MYGKVDTIEMVEVVKEFDGLGLHNELYQHSYGWEYWTDRLDQEIRIKNFGPVKVVDVELQDREAKRMGYEGEQGWEGEIYIVFQVKDPATGGTRYFRKSGTCNSYFNNTWDGTFKEVKMKEEVKYVYV